MKLWAVLDWRPLLKIVFSPPVAGPAGDDRAAPASFFSRVAEHQISLPLDVDFSVAAPVMPELREEIAAAWGLPIGERIEVCFRGGQRSAITGRLDLLRAPDYPWDPHQPLHLNIAGLAFSSREIERWTIV